MTGHDWFCAGVTFGVFTQVFAQEIINWRRRRRMARAAARAEEEMDAIAHKFNCELAAISARVRGGNATKPLPPN